MTNTTTQPKEAPQQAQPKPVPAHKSREVPQTNLIAHKVGAGGLSALGLLLLLSEAPVIATIGLVGVAASGGYAVATVAIEGALKIGRQRLTDYLKVLNAKETTLEKKAIALEADKAEVQQALKLAQSRVTEAEQAAKAIEAAAAAKFDAELKLQRDRLADEFRKRGDALAAEYVQKLESARAESLNRIKFHKSRLVGDNRQLHEEIEALQVKLEQRDAYLLEEFNKRLATYQTEYAELNKAIGIQCQTVGEARAGFEAQYQALIDERDRLRDEVRRLSAPKRFRRNTDNDLRGNKILDFFKSKGVVLEGEDWEERFNHVDYYLFPMPGTSYEQVAPLLNDLQVNLGFYSRPTATADNGFIKLGIKVQNVPEEITVPTRPLSQLETTIRDCNHVSIVGSSGAGKSVFTDNMIWMGKLLWPDSTSTIFDPKFQLENWQSGLNPDYKNQRCVFGIAELSNELYGRLEEYERLTDEGLEPREYPKHIFVVDEAQQLYMNAQDLHIEDKKPNYPAQVARSFTRLLNLGRALGVRGYFIRHNDLVRPLGLNDGQFDGCVNIFLGKGFITKALTKSLRDLFSDAKLSAIQVEYEKRLKIGQQYIALIADIPKSDLYLIEMPSPGHYNRQWEQEMGKSVFPALEGLAPCHLKMETEGQTQTQQSLKPASAGVATVAAVPTSTAPSTDENRPSLSIDKLLDQGSHCPSCGTHSASYKKRKPNGKGNVILRCKNDSCDSSSFSWNVVDAATK